MQIWNLGEIMELIMGLGISGVGLKRVRTAKI
jgi:hypothetical protein